MSKSIFKANLIPHVLLDLSLDSSMASHFKETSLSLMEVIEGCGHINSSSPELEGQQIFILG